MGMKREKANYMIQSVCHALDVMEELARSTGEEGVTELSKRLKLHKNNVFRLLATLEMRGYAEQNKDSEHYRLGVRCLQLGQAYLKQNNLISRARPVINRLINAIGETASLAVLHNGSVQFPVSIEPKKPIRAWPRIAVSFPARANAAGRLLMANLPEAVLEEILAATAAQAGGLPDATLRAMLSELRAAGEIIDRASIEPEVVALARVVRGLNNEVVGAIEVLVPQYRANKIEELQNQIQIAAEELSKSLGAHKTGLAGALEKEISMGADSLGK